MENLFPHRDVNKKSSPQTDKQGRGWEAFTILVPHGDPLNLHVMMFSLIVMIKINNYIVKRSLVVQMCLF
jgi:hypothetical protein